MLSKGVQTLPILGIYSAMSRDNHQIESGEHPLVLSEAFPNQTFDATPVHSSSTTLLGNRQAKSCVIELIGPGKHQKQSIRRTLPITKNPTIIVGLNQSAATRKRTFVSWQGALNSQGDRRTRPLARRAFSTLRPFRVAIRARKPWVLALFKLLG
jgi:hypothetical protein